MSDPLSVSASIVAVVTVTVQSGKALYDAIQSFNAHQTVVARFLHELGGLNKVLASLQDHVQTNEAAFAALKFPLIQCSQACKEFKDMIDKCNKHAKSSRTSFRDWLKLSFMNGDIEAFTRMLAGYKLTVNIALTDAHLRTTKVTLQSLNEYKDLISDTQDELKVHLGNINEKLQALAPSDDDKSVTKVTKIERIELDRDSIEECLKLCNQFLEQINTVQFRVDLPKPLGHTASTVTPQDMTAATAMTLSTFKDCGAKFADTLTRLEVMKQTTEQRLRPGSNIGADAERDIQRLQDEVDSTKQRLAYFEEASARASSARVHVVKNISAGDDSATFVASTEGDLTLVDGATAGKRSLQFFGSTSGNVLQQMLAVHVGNRVVQDRPPQDVVERKKPAVDQMCTSSTSGSSATK